MKKESFLLILFILLLPLTDVAYKNIEFYTSIGFTESLLYVSAYFLVFTVLFTIILFITNNKLKAFSITIVAEILFFNYYTSISLQYRILFFLLGIVFILTLFYITKSEIINKIKFFFFLYLTFNTLLTLSKGIQFYVNTNQKIIEEDIWTQQTNVEPAIKPNIYFIVVDQMASLDVAKSEFDIDTTTFTKFLRENGYILPKAHSNYLYTPLSILSTLSGSYLTKYLEKQESNYQFALGTQYLRNELSLFSSLEKIGYQNTNYSIFNLKSGRLKNDIDFSNYLKKENKPLIINTLLSASYQVLLSKIGIKTNGNIDNFIKKLDLNENRIIKLLNDSYSKPTFNYFHFFTTHDPFYIKVNNKLVYQPFKDDIDYKERYSIAYHQAMKQLIEVIELIKRKEKKAVVIIIGDHGYRLFSKEKQHLAFESFCAVKMLNDEDNIGFPLKISNVNIFRWIGNKYFKQNNAILENKKIGKLYK